MRNRQLSEMRGSETVHPHRRSEGRPFPNRGASLLSGLSYRGDLMREPLLAKAQVRAVPATDRPAQRAFVQQVFGLAP